MPPPQKEMKYLVMSGRGEVTENIKVIRDGKLSLFPF